MFANVISWINGYLWSTPMLVLVVCAGLYFTFRLRFVQIRKIPTQLHLLFNGKSSDRGMSSFQAFCLAIAGRVGTGNIAGVATAIAAGGPGALFWMWIMALIGAATSFVECTMAQLYKGEVNGEYRGGIAYYLGRGTKIRFLGYLFAVVMIVAELAMFGIQSHEIAAATENAFSVPTWITGVVLIVLLALIIFGGAKRIASVANIVVPFMAIAYVLIALIILFANANNIPETFATIFQSAFGAQFVAIALMFFAFTTIMNMFYNCETALTFFFHKSGEMPSGYVVSIRLIVMLFVFIGTVVSGSTIWSLGDVGCGMLIWGNVFCLLFLVPKAALLLRDFESQQKQGIDPVFNPSQYPQLGDLPLWKDAYEGYESGKLKN